MIINRSAWLRYSLIALIGLFFWAQLSYPQLNFIKLKIDRTEALLISQQYLSSQGIRVDEYKSAAALNLDSRANKYLQMNLGFSGMLAFLKEHDFDMFFWMVRFFKEGEIEEYRLNISASTGDVVAFIHEIKDTEATPFISRDEAQEKAINLLKEKFGFDPSAYSSIGDLSSKHDNRTDYGFSWIKNSVAIPWSGSESDGTAKLAIGATVSGGDFLSFYKNSFSVPEQFSRQEARKRNVAHNIGIVVNVLKQALLIFAIYFIAVRRNHLAMHLTKRFYIGCFALAIALSVSGFFNQFESFVFNYKTTVPFVDHVLRSIVSLVVSTIIASLALLMPSLSGELLHYEVSRDKPDGSFLHYCLSTFFSRHVAGLIGLGYLVFFVLLGMQSVIISLGQSFLDVWTEQIMMTKLTNAYWPVLAAITLGFNAALFEELMYRLFAISLFKKIFKNTILAVICSSVIWGFAHTGYPVYPMWFRGIEVTVLGIFLSFIYLRFGLIPVIVAHFLFDVFWACSAFIFGESGLNMWVTSMVALFIPLLWAAAAYVLNCSNVAKPMQWHFNKHQTFNMNVLLSYLNQNQSQWKGIPEKNMIHQLSSHGWDVAVVEEAVKKFNQSSK